MVNEHFSGPAQQRKLHSELSRLGSSALAIMGDNSGRAASGGPIEQDGPASTDDVAALSFACDPGSSLPGLRLLQILSCSSS